MKIVIIKYNAGNSFSLFYALKRLGYDAIISDDEQQIKSADKVLFPGQGQASTAMEYLQERKLDILIKNLTQPVLGICLGMQLMCNYSEENNTPCFGLIDSPAKKINVPDKVPQMGWNSLINCKNKLFTNIKEGSFVYYANSFYIPHIKETIANTEYHILFSAALHKDNFYGIQFHPEKSGQVGEQILKNFLTLC